MHLEIVQNVAHTVIHHPRVGCPFLLASHLTLSLELGITDLTDFITVEKGHSMELSLFFIKASFH